VELSKLGTAEEALPGKPARSLGAAVLKAEVSLLPTFLQDLHNSNCIPHCKLSQSINILEQVDKATESPVLLLLQIILQICY
jgi:hypothetical protein